MNREKYRGTTEAVGSASRGFPVYLRLKKESDNYLRTDGACSMKYTVWNMYVGLICSLRASKQTNKLRLAQSPSDQEFDRKNMG